jgi:FkbM family methyltransferase
MKIVQIGTCVANDDLTQLIGNINPEILVLVEPMSIHNDKINQCYSGTKNVFIENVAITTKDEDEMIFYYHKNDGPMYEVATTDINHIIKHGYDKEGVVELKVKCVTINKLFKNYELKKIDILFVDAEGLDDEIIKSIDFSIFDISKIYFENLHLKDNKIYQFLEILGYKITKNVGYNGWSSLAEKNM